ncbi:MAG: TIGR02391 family protein [Anaerolineae bacterium]|nr:TIGR02391 family protein [Anaerolineae bacterium]
MLITSDQVDELVSVMANLSGLDGELAARCGGLVREQRYDEAVGRAFVVLEERMRALMGMSGGSGRNLVSRLFSEKDMRYIERLNLPEEEWKGIRSIFDGAFAAYRNRTAHAVVDYSLDETRAIVHLVNLLLLIVRQIHQAPELHVPETMAQILGPAVTHRLNLFLDSLPTLGIARGKGKYWIPYKAKLVYHPSNWEEPKKHRFAVFYLTTTQSPVLGFNMGALACVPGLDVERLASQLVQAGCSRVPSKDFSIQLILPDRNDQATFDHLYDILRDLVQKHGG